MKRSKILLFVLTIMVFGYLSACSKSAENEHLPEYCRTYSGFMETASPDIYELVDGINRYDYLDAISVIELEFEVDDPSREIDLDGIQCFQNLTSLKLSGRSFKDISEISALKNIQEIHLNNTSVVSIDSFKNLSKVNVLVISNTKSLQSVKGVEEMTKLTTLELVDNGIVTIDALSQLVNLTSLNLSGNEMTHIPEISGLEYLTTLDLSRNKISTMGEDLSGLANVINLDLSNNEICDLTRLDDLDDLRILDLQFNDLGCGLGIPDFSSLENSSRLKELYLNDNDIKSIETLNGIDLPQLEVLHLQNNLITDISYISGYNSVLDLRLENNSIEDISGLSGMANLSAINLSHNNVTGFGGLTELSGLQVIELQYNKITTIPELKNDLPLLRYLDLSFNNLEDTSGVAGHPNLEYLDLSYSKIKTLSGINNMISLEEFYITKEVECETSEDFFVTQVCTEVIGKENNISKIENSFWNLPLLDMVNGVTGDIDFPGLDNNDTNGLYVLDTNFEIVHSFINVVGLKHVTLDDYGITSIDADSFVSSTMLSLDISQNPITSIEFLRGNPNLRDLNISHTNVQDLSILNGTDHTDFDQLIGVIAQFIEVPNELNGAFIDLPNLSVISVVGTPITSITDSFNGLNQLTTLNIDSDQIQTITNSFNGLFLEFIDLEVDNVFPLQEGEIGVIENSFNNSYFGYIYIDQQQPSITETYIDNSFNDTIVAGKLVLSQFYGLSFENSDFATISNSFQSSSLALPSFRNSNISSITSSFGGTTIKGRFDLSQNRLTTMESTSNFIIETFVLDEQFQQLSINPQLFLQENQLDNVSFIEGLPDLEVLDISSQSDDLGDPTLTSLNGINDFPNLLIFNFTGNAITEIDGLNNLGITTFELSKEMNSSVEISTISSNSFEGTNLIELDLEESYLGDIGFLQNLDGLESLILFTSLNDISIFSTLPMKDDLQTLQLESSGEILSFSPLNGYERLERLELYIDNTILNDLDGFGLNADLPTSLLLFSSSPITEIHNSFNNVSMVQSPNMLLGYASVTTITNSFDMLTVDGVQLNAALNITDSFNNLPSVAVDFNGLPIMNIDGDSLDSVTSFTGNNVALSSYSLFNDYESIEQITLNDVATNITDFIHTNSITLTINSSELSLTQIQTNMTEGSVLEVNVLGDISLVVNNQRVHLDVPAEVTLNSTIESLSLFGDVEDTIVNSATLTTINFTGDFRSNTLTIDADLLEAVSHSKSQNIFNNNQLVISSLSSNLEVITPYTDVTIQNNNLSSLTSDLFRSGTNQVYTEQNTVSINNISTELLIHNSILSTLTISGNTDVVTVNSNDLATVQINDADGTVFDLTSTVASFNISSNNSSEHNITLQNDLLTTLTVDASDSLVTVNSSYAGSMTMLALAARVEIVNPNMTDLTMSNSSLNEMELNTVNSLTSVLITNSTINTSNISSTQSSITYSNDQSTTLTLAYPNMNYFDITSGGDVTILSSIANVNNVDIVADSLTMTGDLQSFSVTGTSSLTTLNLPNGVGLNSVTLQNAPIGSVSIGTEASIFTITGSQTALVTVNGLNLQSLNASISGNINMNLGTNAGLTLDVIASDVSIDGANISGVTMTSTTDINQLTILDSQVSTFNANNAAIDVLNLEGVANNISLSGANILSATINDATITSVNATLSLSSLLSVLSTQNVTVNTNTQAVTIEGQDVILNSSTLQSATLDVANATFNVTKPNLVFAIEGSIAGTALFNTANVDGINLNNSTSIQTLELDYTNVTSIDDPENILANVIVTTDSTSFTVATDAGNVDLNGVDLNTITYTTTNTSGIVSVVSNAPSLNIDGTYGSLVIENHFATSIDVANASIVALELQTNTLSLFSASTEVQNSLDIATLQNAFTITSNTPIIRFNGPNTGTMTLHTAAALTSVETNASIVELNALASTSLVLDAANATSISGLVDSLLLQQNAAAVMLTIDMDASEVTIDSTNNMTALMFAGNRAIGTVVVESGVQPTLSVVTQDVTIQSVTVEGSTQTLPSLYLATKAAFITVHNTESAEVDLYDLSTIELEGNVDNLTVTATSLQTLTTNDNLTVNTQFEMTDSLITNLEFMTSSLLSTVDTLVINTLTTGNTDIDAVNTKLSGTSISLVSPITDVMVYNYFYAAHYAVLEADELSNGTIYTNLRTIEIDEAEAVFTAVEYFDYLGSETIRSQIDTQTYSTAQVYFDGYATSIGTNEADMRTNNGDTFVDDIFTAIQAVLDNPELIIDETALNNAVLVELDNQAILDATTSNNLKTWSIG